MNKQQETIKLGIIGLDTSHATSFTELLSNREHPYHVEGACVAAAYPGGSPDFELSISRVADFTERMRSQYQVEIVDSPEAVAERCDAILLESADGRVHLEQFRRIAPFGRPVFIDKPLAVSAQDAREIFVIADEYGIPVMSCSSLRYAAGLLEKLDDAEKGAIVGMDVYGPMAMQPTQPGLFWYGIHSAEMLFAVLGPHCVRVAATSTADHDLIVGTWADGRIGAIRGNRIGNNEFGALLHRERGSQLVDVQAHPKPYYASLLEQVMRMFRTGTPQVPAQETLAIIRFIEAANSSRETGRAVTL